MEIDDTIQALVKIGESIDTWVPERITRPDVLLTFERLNKTASCGRYSYV